LHEAEKLLSAKEALRLGIVDEIVTKWDDIGESRSG